MDVLAKVTSKGRLTLPKTVRRALDLREGGRVLFRVQRGRAILSKIPDFLGFAGSVPVSPAVRDVAWSEIKATTWSRRAAARR